VPGRQGQGPQDRRRRRRGRQRDQPRQAEGRRLRRREVVHERQVREPVDRPDLRADRAEERPEADAAGRLPVVRRGLLEGRRQYPAHFASKVSDAEGEAEETRVWLEFAQRCGYMPAGTAANLDDAYDKIVAQLVLIRTRPNQWSTA